MHESEFGYCSFVPRHKKVRLRIGKVDFYFGQKNKWDGNWLTYWFYIKITHVSTKSSVPQFPFTSKVETVSFKTTVDFIVSEQFLKEVGGLPHKVLFPRFGVAKPTDCNESIFVLEIERSTSEAVQ